MCRGRVWVFSHMSTTIPIISVSRRQTYPISTMFMFCICVMLWYFSVCHLQMITLRKQCMCVRREDNRFLVKGLWLTEAQDFFVSKWHPRGCRTLNFITLNGKTLRLTTRFHSLDEFWLLLVTDPIFCTNPKQMEKSWTTKHILTTTQSTLWWWVFIVEYLNGTYNVL